MPLMARPAQKQHTRLQNKRLYRRKRARVAPPGYVTSAVLMERVGLSLSQFKSLAAKKLIAADGENGEGYGYYPEKLVQQLLIKKADGSLFRNARTEPAGQESTLANYTPEQGVHVFELLHEGKSSEQIVLILGSNDATRVHPLIVKRIREDYDEMTGSIHLPRAIVEQINQFEHLPGTFPLTDAAGLFDMIEQVVQNRLCSECKQIDSVGLCAACIMAQRRREKRDAHDPTTEVMHSASDLQTGSRSRRDRAVADRRSAPARIDERSEGRSEDEPVASSPADDDPPAEEDDALKRALREVAISAAEASRTSAASSHDTGTPRRRQRRDPIP